MSSKKDLPEAVGTMEIFLLALIGRVGLKSLYELKEKAGLQPGGIRPVLKKLEKRGFLVWELPGRRNRRTLELTIHGVDFLESFWKRCQQVHWDADSAVRAAWVSLVMGGPEAAASYCKQIAHQRGAIAQEATMKSGYWERSQSDALATLEWMRISTEAFRRNAECDAFLSIGHYLERRSAPDAHQVHLRQGSDQ